MNELDPIIHAPSRLRVMASLAALGTGNQITFPVLQRTLDMTAGNLSTHLRRLEEADYVTVTKSFAGRTPSTQVGLTPRGRLAFEEYTRALTALLTPEAP